MIHKLPARVSGPALLWGVVVGFLLWTISPSIAVLTAIAVATTTVTLHLTAAREGHQQGYDRAITVLRGEGEHHAADLLQQHRYKDTP